MKPLMHLAVLASLLFGTALFAQQGGGFVNPAAVSDKGAALDRYHTVKGAKTLPDDAKVNLRGFILERISSEHYLFRDDISTDEAGNRIGGDQIVIEIDDDKWQGQTITPNDLVVIVGEVDKDDGEVKIDVKNIRKNEAHAWLKEREAKLKTEEKTKPKAETEAHKSSASGKRPHACPHCKAAADKQTEAKAETKAEKSGEQQ